MAAVAAAAYVTSERATLDLTAPKLQHRVLGVRRLAAGADGHTQEQQQSEQQQQQQQPGMAADADGHTQQTDQQQTDQQAPATATFELTLVPATARELLSSVHASFAADDLREVYRMHAAYKAQAAGGARLRRSASHFAKSSDEATFSWNYNTKWGYGNDITVPFLDDDEYAAQMYDSYVQASAPVKIDVDWGASG